MNRSTAGRGSLVLLVLAGLLGVQAASAAPAGDLLGYQASVRAAAIDLPLLAPKPVPKVIPPVAAPAISDPPGPVHGTMIMVHAGGWAGHDEYAQDVLMARPGNQLLGLGWRIISLDYEEGTAGLQDVLNTAGAELVRRTSDGPVCLYGESAGGHLSLVAASRLRGIDCVIALGPPTDLSVYQEEAAASPDGRLKLVASQMTRFFGTTDTENAPWDPASLAPTIHADVMLFREDDDVIVSPKHNENFKANRVTTQNVVLEAGAPTEGFVHGTVSPAGRAVYASAIRVFTNRVIAARTAEVKASRFGCAGDNRTVGEIALDKLRRALRCLASRDPVIPSRPGDWKRTSFQVRGEVNAARIWAKMRRTKVGRRALAAAVARRARITVRRGDLTRVIFSKAS